MGPNLGETAYISLKPICSTRFRSRATYNESCINQNTLTRSFTSVSDLGIHINQNHTVGNVAVHPNIHDGKLVGRIREREYSPGLSKNDKRRIRGRSSSFAVKDGQLLHRRTEDKLCRVIVDPAEKNENHNQSAGMRTVYDYKHWVAAACISDNVYVANSLGSAVSLSVSKQLKQLFEHCVTARCYLPVKVVECAQQPNMDDCGVFAAAFVTEWATSSINATLDIQFDVQRTVCANICCAAWNWNCSVCCRFHGFAPRAAVNIRTTP